MFFIKTNLALHWGDSQKNQRKLRLGKKHTIIQAWSSLSRKWMRGFSRDNDMLDDEEEDYPETIQPEYVLRFSIESRMVCRWKNYQLHNKCVQKIVKFKIKLETNMLNQQLATTKPMNRNSRSQADQSL